MAPIGVFDSGMGGLTVVSALRAVLADEQLIYLGDTARVPYGTKSAATVIRYATQIANLLVQRGIKYLIVACNTASAHALDYLKNNLDIPVMGVVRPGARYAATVSHCKKIGVIGTLGTITSGAYLRALHEIDPLLTIFSVACPLLVPLAEEGWGEHPVTAQVVQHYLLELRAQSKDLDTIVLGCTHYPLLANVIASEAAKVFGHKVNLVDSAKSVAQEVAADLEKLGLKRPPTGLDKKEDCFIFTDVSRFETIARRFLGKDIPKAEQVDI